MRIATWNVNSINARLETVLPGSARRSRTSPACRKSSASTRSFPPKPLNRLGYNVAVHGQKTYNGVAMLSKSPMEDIRRGLPERRRRRPRPLYRGGGPRPRPVRVGGHLPAQRQSDRHGEVRLQAARGWTRLNAHAREPAGAGGADGADRRLQRHPGARATPTIRPPGPATPCSSPRVAAAFRALKYLGLTDAYMARRRLARRLHLLGLSGRRLAAEPRHPHRPRPALAPGRRRPDQRGHPSRRPGAGKAVGPCTGGRRTGPVSPARTLLSLTP